MSEKKEIFDNDNYTDYQKHIDAGWEPATPDDHMTDEEKIYRLNIEVDRLKKCNNDLERKWLYELDKAEEFYEQLSRYREALEKILQCGWGVPTRIAREALEPKP